MIVFPMAGLSRRFTEAGYGVPKYMLEAHGRSLFDQAVLSFKSYFADLPFLFIARDVMETGTFIRERCAALGIADARVVTLDAPTRGQAETVALGLQFAGVDAGESLTIFNIDTFRPGFTFPAFANAPVDGFLETFEGEGSNWSFVRPVEDGSDRAAETSEKRPISRFCCTGLYHFSQTSLFWEGYQTAAALPNEQLEGGELYIAPMYNSLIAAGRDIRFSVVPRDAVVFCGVPAEYDALLGRAAVY